MAKPAKVLARGWYFSVQRADGWFFELGSVSAFTPNASQTNADGTDFKSAGEEHTPALRGLTVNVEGYYLEDEHGGRDIGQALIEEYDVALRAAFRMISPAGNAREFNASYNVTVGGGGNTEIARWAVEVTKSGPIYHHTCSYDGDEDIDGDCDINGDMDIPGDADGMDVLPLLLGIELV